MGLRMLSSPETLMELASKDPEHFNLIIGFCMRKKLTVADEFKADSERMQKKRAEMERLKKEQEEQEHNKKKKLKPWHDALADAANHIRKRLCVYRPYWDVKIEDTYHGYFISIRNERARNGQLQHQTKVSNDRFTQNSHIDEGSIRKLCEIAYLCLANRLYLLPISTDGDYGVKHEYHSSLKDSIPEWFDQSKPLPRIPEI